MEDPKKNIGGQNPATKGPQGVGVPAKGDSSPSQVPLDPDPFDGATISDVPRKPPTPPTTRVANIDLTLAESIPGATSALGRSLTGSYVPEVILNPGDVIGARYELLELLGEGGMGAVFKAHDIEIDRFVALKVIRPELARNPTILARFKQELQTAHQVTHKNVIRIYDIAEADGVKFITMEFVDGSDLRRWQIDHGKFTHQQSVDVIRQTCLALDAAHSAGIIHRDLKPQNIMKDNKSGRILVMDFGLARSLQSDGMTQTGMLLGTIDYMSPEQAMGKTLDARSDLFTLGLIFYELLSDTMPYKAETAMASLLKRNQDRAVPLTELDPSIPKPLSDIVGKCLERDVDRRYQSAAEIIADLDAWEGKRPVAASMIAPAPSVVIAGSRELPWKWIAVGALTIVAVSVGYMLKPGSVRNTSGTSTAPKAPEISLAILPFHNATTDAALDWLGPSLADMLSTDVGQSASLHTVSSNRLHQVLKDMHITDNADFDPDTLKRLAEFSNANTLVWGRYAKFGDQIRIDATLQDLKHNRTIPLKIQAPSEKEIPATVDGLAELIRKNLAVSSDVVKELKASSFQPSSKSVAALRDYNQGLVAQRDGKSQNAQELFESATKEDPSFALAFSRLAQAYSSLRYDDQAEQAARRAVDLSQDLPQAERYLIAAIHAQIRRNYPESIKSYENLAKVAPGNSDVEAALASLYEQAGDLANATQYNQEILKANPNDRTAMVALGRLAILSGKPETALEPLNRANSLAVQLDNQEQKASSLHFIGLAYARMNKPQEALRYYQEELPIWRQLGRKSGIALSLNEMANVQARLGDNKNAQANFQQALALRREIGDKVGLGDTLIDVGNFEDDRGNHDEALKMYKEALQIQRDLGNEALQAGCLNNIGVVYFEKAQYEDARSYYQQALQLREKANLPLEIVNSVGNLADVSVRMGEYDQAVPLYMKALDLQRSLKDTRGAATVSDTLGVMYGYQGRYGAAVSSLQGAFDTFQELKDRTTGMAEITANYGEALTLAGRGEEAKKILEDSLNLSRELKNDGLMTQALAFQGDAAFYRGDTKSARGLYEQALQAATRSKEKGRILAAKVALAKLAAQEGSPQQAISSLRPLIQQADELGMRNVSLDCSISLAEAMFRAHDTAKAKQYLESVVLRTEKMGLKPLSAKGYYLLANIARASGDQVEAQHQYRSVVQLLDTMKQDKGAEKLLERQDFKTMYEEATRGSQATKS